MKTFTLLLLSVVALFVSGIPAMAQTRTRAEVKETVKMHRGPGANHKAYGAVKKGSLVDVLAKKSEWSHVVFHGVDYKGVACDYEGYVMSKYLSFFEVEDVSKYAKVDEPQQSMELTEIGCESITPEIDSTSKSVFEIHAESANYNSIVKMVRLSDSKCVRMAFVKAGDVFVVKNVPYGTYCLKILSGNDLRKKNDDKGRCILSFAENSVCEKPSDKFSFYRETAESGSFDMGWSFVLSERKSKKDAAGLNTSEIDPDEF